MSNTVKWTNRAATQLLKLDKRYQHAIRDKAAMLKDFPAVSADIKKMAGGSNRYRMRIGAYRLIFEWQTGQEPHIIEIQQVSTRQSAYKH
ncbi:type II toxin-antitoxin system RelE/ParE family toxin [Eikenella halliae]|uniref:type II toxin-antitoxin system RelE family toxin n=1 Tax=Eikenella halliae TaxID=1795832 RepID=UPI0028D5BDE2|nr:type II toxin-antitoxin system RelE/ParE family toxin [Eikenella halliae]